MSRTAVQSNHQCLHPAAQQAEKVPRTDLAVGGFQHAAQASVVIPVGRLGLEHFTKRLFKRIVHMHLSVSQ